MASVASPAPPYASWNTPLQRTIPHNGANFHTLLYRVPAQLETKGRIIYLHGFSEQEANYAHLFDDLCDSGYEVIFFAQRGQGRTSIGKSRGVTDERRVFDDLEFFIEYNVKETGRGFLFLGGHSMGGAIALEYGVTGKHRDVISGIFVTCPMLKAHPTTLPHPILVFLGEIVELFHPWMKIDTKVDADKLTSVSEWVQFIRCDPLQSPFVATLKQFKDAFARGEKLLKSEHSAKFDKIPVLLIQGHGDMIVDETSATVFMDLVSVEDKTLVFLDDARHSLHMERRELYEEMKTHVIGFLDQHTAQAASN